MNKRKNIFCWVLLAAVLLVFGAGCDAGLSSSANPSAAGQLPGKSSLLIIPSENTDIIVPENYTAVIEESDSFELLAGKTISSGSVNISIDNEYLTVEYAADFGFGIDEVHLWIGTVLNDLPRNRGGNPVPGHFPYKASDLGGISSFSIMIPLSETGLTSDISSQSFFAAAHAAVSRPADDGTVQTESAWAEGDRITARGNWGTYFSFTVSFEEDVLPPPDFTEETAYAEEDTRPFKNFFPNNSDWGWVIKFSVNSDKTTPLYADAADYDTSNATKVGNARYTFDNSLLTVEYLMDDGFYLKETNVYAGRKSPGDPNPEHYGNSHKNLDYAVSDYYEIPVTLNENPIGSGNYEYGYLIIHAVVYGEF